MHSLGFVSVLTSLPRAFAPPARRARRARPPKTSTGSAALYRAVLGEVCRLRTCRWWIRERPCRRRLECASCLSRLGRLPATYAFFSTTSHCLLLLYRATKSWISDQHRKDSARASDCAGGENILSCASRPLSAWRTYDTTVAVPGTRYVGMI